MFDLCAQHPVPIPFYGELGSVNPMFILPTAAQQNGADIGGGWVGSVPMGAGQFCTNPGIAIILKDKATDFIAATAAALKNADAQTTLTDGIATAYRDGQFRVAASSGFQEVIVSSCERRSATPSVYNLDSQ